MKFAIAILTLSLGLTIISAAPHQRYNNDHDFSNYDNGISQEYHETSRNTEGLGLGNLNNILGEGLLGGDNVLSESTTYTYVSQKSNRN
jgi:hypothetical protein